MADFDEKVGGTGKSSLGLEVVSNFRVLKEFHFAKVRYEKCDSDKGLPQVFALTFSSKSAHLSHQDLAVSLAALGQNSRR